MGKPQKNLLNKNMIGECIKKVYRAFVTPLDKIILYGLLFPRIRNHLEIASSLAKGREPTKVVLRNGICIEAPHGRNSLLAMVHEIFSRRVYNPGNLSIETDDVVVDIGANVGVFTLFAASMTKNHVYSVEPFPANVCFLEQNIRRNGLHNVTVACTAVSEAIGSANLFLSRCAAGHLLFDHSIEGTLERYVNVPTTTLCEFMDTNSLQEIDFLKMDCEGCEGAILSSTPRAYLRRIRKIALEFHDNISELKHYDIQKLLEEEGFTTKLSWNGKGPFGYLYACRAEGVI